MSEDISVKLLRNVEQSEEHDNEEEKLKNRIWNESKKMWIVAAPAIFTRFSTFGTSVITQAFVGHIGATQLAAYSLVQTVLLRFANGILVNVSYRFLYAHILSDEIYYRYKDFSIFY